MLILCCVVIMVRVLSILLGGRKLNPLSTCRCCALTKFTGSEIIARSYEREKQLEAKWHLQNTMDQKNDTRNNLVTLFGHAVQKFKIRQPIINQVVVWQNNIQNMTCNFFRNSGYMPIVTFLDVFLILIKMLKKLAPCRKWKIIFQ